MSSVLFLQLLIPLRELSYLQYANICARALRNSLKDEARVAAARRNENNLKYAKWENGNQKELVSVFWVRIVRLDN